MEVWVRPGAAVDRIHGQDPWTNRLVISMRAPPVSGKANRSLIDLLASTLDLPKNRIRIVHGANSRKKRVEIIGLEVVEFPRFQDQEDEG